MNVIDKWVCKLAERRMCDTAKMLYQAINEQEEGIPEKLRDMTAKWKDKYATRLESLALEIAGYEAVKRKAENERRTAEANILIEMSRGWSAPTAEEEARAVEFNKQMATKAKPNPFVIAPQYNSAQDEMLMRLEAQKMQQWLYSQQAAQNNLSTTVEV